MIAYHHLKCGKRSNTSMMPALNAASSPMRRPHILIFHCWNIALSLPIFSPTASWSCLATRSRRCAASTRLQRRQCVLATPRCPPIQEYATRRSERGPRNRLHSMNENEIEGTAKDVVGNVKDGLTGDPGLQLKERSTRQQASFRAVTQLERCGTGNHASETVYDAGARAGKYVGRSVQQQPLLSPSEPRPSAISSGFSSIRQRARLHPSLCPGVIAVDQDACA